MSRAVEAAMPISVLIIGTDEDFRGHIKARLLTEGFQIAETSSESDSEELLARQEVDVVLLDLTGIGQRGIPFIGRVQAAQPLAKVIVLIPKNGLKLSLAAMQHEAYDDLMVPFSWKDLLKKVKAAAKQKNLEQKGKKGFWRTLEDHMTAISFAEGGASDLAREVIRPEEQSSGAPDRRSKEGEPGKAAPGSGFQKKGERE
jgi:DNA-binding NtrC family response regulator